MGLRSDFSTALIKKTFKQRFFMAKLTKVPLIGRLMIYVFFDEDDMIYLPKDDVVRKEITAIRMDVTAQPESVVMPSQVIDHFLRDQSTSSS
jgi:hypothetical protein